MKDAQSKQKMRFYLLLKVMSMIFTESPERTILWEDGLNILAGIQILGSHNYSEMGK